ncbi:hypothetical protein ACIP3A_30490 [Streptomyces tricolor]|uniref:hypothetical protein n=2 Tax=Streptomyces tricolor TaxID=68277 RepID=UPI00380A73E1
MRRVLIPTVAAAVVLMSGCSEDVPGCGWENRPKSFPIEGEKRPVKIRPSEQHPGLGGREVTAALPPRPDRDAGPTAQALYDLQEKTLDMVGELGEIEPGRCEGGELALDVGDTTRCTVIYEDVEVPWQVKITNAVPQGLGTPYGIDYQYTARPLETVVLAQEVYDWFAWEAGKNGPDSLSAPKEPRCDRLPKIFTAEPGRDTGYYCQHLSWSCTDGDFDFEWSDVPIRVDEEGEVRVDGSS